MSLDSVSEQPLGLIPLKQVRATGVAPISRKLAMQDIGAFGNQHRSRDASQALEAIRHPILPKSSASLAAGS